jgi:hypothetical protein
MSSSFFKTKIMETCNARHQARLSNESKVHACTAHVPIRAHFQTSQLIKSQHAVLCSSSEIIIKVVVGAWNWEHRKKIIMCGQMKILIACSSWRNAIFNEIGSKCWSIYSSWHGTFAFYSLVCAAVKQRKYSQRR